MENSSSIVVKDIVKDYHLYPRNIERVKEALHPLRKKYYRSFRALDNISFEVKKGEAFGIIGRNGGGKSTLLQIICGIVKPNKGTVQVKGRVAALLELGAGFSPEFTGRENVYVNAAILGLDDRQIASRIDSIISFADIGDFIDQKVKFYSSGMFMRLAFAVATSVDADILLIDEALAVGDFFFRQKCYDRLNKLREKGVSIVLVTHAMNEVQQFCQRAILLNNGKTLFCGNSTEAVEQYYLINQSRTTNKVKSDNANQEISNLEDFSCDISWPGDNIFVSLSDIKQVSSGVAKCTRIALCDSNLNPTNSFQKGDVAVILSEFQLYKCIDIPTGGITITNDKGQIVHGKNTLQYESNTPFTVPNGAKVKFRQEIKLDLAYGEYAMDIGFGAIKQIDFDNRRFMRYDELESKVERLCVLPSALQFAILHRDNPYPFQMLHHGIADLPGNCKIYVDN